MVSYNTINSPDLIAFFSGPINYMDEVSEYKSNHVNARY